MRRPAGRCPALWILSLAFTLLVATAPRADAADAGGIVRVHVASTGVAPAVVVTMSSPAVPGRTWSARVEAGRIVTFRNLPPATYTVTATPEDGSGTSGGTSPATSPARSPARSIDASVDAGGIADLDARFSAGASVLEIVALSRVADGVTFATRMLNAVPAQSAWGLLDASEPFVIVDRMDNGGLMTGQSALVGSRGSSWTNLTMSYGDVEVTGPGATGRAGVVPDLIGVDAVAVTTGLAPVDLASPGADLALVLKRPGASPHGVVAAGVTTGRMAGRNDTTAVPSIYRLDSLSTASGEFGTPLTSHAGLFVATDATRSQQETRSEKILLPGNLASVFGHVVVHPTGGDELRASATVQRASTAFDGRDQFANRGVTERDTFVVAEAAWEHLGPAGRRSIAFGLNRAVLTPDVATGLAGGTVDRVLDGVLPAAPATTAGNRASATLEFDPRDAMTGRVAHAVRLGLIVRRSSDSTSVLALPTVGETVDGLAARVWMNQAPVSSTSDRQATEVTAFASDLMQIAPRLTLDVGLRANVTAGSAVGAVTGVSWKTVAPRVGLTWAPNLVTLFAAYSRYYSPLPIDWLAWGDPGAPTSEVFRWIDANHDGRFETGEQGALVALSGSGAAIASIDPALRQPVTDELTFGAEHWFGTSFRLHVAATIRRERDLAAVVDTGAPTSSYAQSFISDQGEDYFGTADDRPLAVYNRLPSSFGLDKYLLTNPEGDTGRYEGIEISGEARGTHISSIVGAMAYLTRAGASSQGFTALENDQGLLGQRYTDPNAQPFEPGSVFFDRSYVLKWTTAFDAPGDVHAAIGARYQDGQPFTRLVLAPDLNQGPEIIQAYRAGRTRFLYTVTIDAQVSKTFRFGRGRQASLTVNVFNLTNQANEVEENPVTGPAFRLTTAVQPPRTIRVGFNVKF